MRFDRIEYFKNLALTKFTKTIEETQKQIDASKQKRSEIKLYGKFFVQFVQSLPEKEKIELLTDPDAMLPMPGSVEKQLLSLLFTPHRVNLLCDMEVWDSPSQYYPHYFE